MVSVSVIALAKRDYACFGKCLCLALHWPFLLARDFKDAHMASMGRSFQFAALMLSVMAPLSANADAIPTNITRQLPRGYAVLTSAQATKVFGRTYYFIALASLREASLKIRSSPAPARPLLIYEGDAHGRFTLVGRNDEVILGADDGGQCDPFEPGHIATKGAFFTIENEVACGQHWTDYVTFRFEPTANGYIFDNWRGESWSMNPSTDPNAEALISNGPKIVHASRQHKIPFAQWSRDKIK